MLEVATGFLIKFIKAFTGKHADLLFAGLATICVSFFAIKLKATIPVDTVSSLLLDVISIGLAIPGLIAVGLFFFRLFRQPQDPASSRPA